MNHADDAAARAAALADRLRDAHRRVPSLDVPDDQKARAARRLLAISDASKQDVDRAAKRLDALLADWDAGRVGASDPSDSD